MQKATFRDFYLTETMATGVGTLGAAAQAGDSSGYAAGDARLPKVLGAIQRRPGLRKLRKKKKNGTRTLDSQRKPQS